MKKPRIKLTQPLIRTRAELDSLIGDIADLTIRRNQLQLDLDERIRIARESFEGRISSLDQSIIEKTDLARGWSDSHQEYFAGKKSLDTLHGTIGYRTGTPKLKTLSGWTWDRVLCALETLGMKRFIRVKSEPAKDIIIAAHPAELSDIGLRAVGLQITQEESFFCDPHLTETQNRVTTEAA